MRVQLGSWMITCKRWRVDVWGTERSVHAILSFRHRDNIRGLQVTLEAIGRPTAPVP